MLMTYRTSASAQQGQHCNERERIVQSNCSSLNFTLFSLDAVLITDRNRRKSFIERNYDDAPLIETDSMDAMETNGFHFFGYTFLNVNMPSFLVVPWGL